MEGFCCYAETLLMKRLHWYNTLTIISVGHRHA